MQADREPNNSGEIKPTGSADGVQRPQLKKTLNGWQIFFIALSAVIGTGIFSHDGLALSVSGPGGLVLATGIVGLIAMAFMDGLSELIQVFPCSNALVEYVHAFVDPDLGVVVGIAYWATWAVFYSLQLAAAADFCSAWSLKIPDVDIALRVLVFFVFFPLLLIWINTRSVNLFGWIETVGGFIKLLVITALSLILYYLAGLNQGLQSSATAALEEIASPNGTYLDDGFISTADFPHSAANFFAVLPIVAFSWIGIEIVAVTAFEALRLDDLKLPSQRLPYVTLIVYMVCGIGSGMSVKYSNQALSHIFRGSTSTSATLVLSLEVGSPVNSSGSLIVIAANQVGQYTMAQVFNGFLIFSALSAGNTGLYVASRTLYGLAFNSERHDLWLQRWLSTVNRSGVPVNAAFVSALAFCWLPFLSLRDIPTTTQDYTQGDRKVDAASQQFLNTAASVSAIFVWGAECLAFVRYYHWLKKHSGRDGLLQRSYPELNRWTDDKLASTLLGFLQPGVAYFGLVGCFLIFLVLPSAMLWGNIPSGAGASASLAYQVLEIFITPILLILLWLGLKAHKWYDNKEVTWFVSLDNDEAKLEHVLKNLKRLSEEPPTESPSSSWNERVNGGVPMANMRQRRFGDRTGQIAEMT